MRTVIETFISLHSTAARNIKCGNRRRRRSHCCGISADDERGEEKRREMLSWFADFPGEGHIYSIHNMCQVGMRYVIVVIAVLYLVQCISKDEVITYCVS